MALAPLRLVVLRVTREHQSKHKVTPHVLVDGNVVPNQIDVCSESLAFADISHFPYPGPQNEVQSIQHASATRLAAYVEEKSKVYIMLENSRSLCPSSSSHFISDFSFFSFPFQDNFCR